MPVVAGDVLVTMDGEGAIGKAAAYRGTQPVRTDSHVARLRLLDPSLADAVACYLNSSFGWWQLDRATSGSTGQTQISAHDLGDVLVPAALLSSAGSVGGAYNRRRTAYSPRAARVRALLCEAAAALTEALLADADLSDGARACLTQYRTAPECARLLARLTPRMF